MSIRVPLDELEEVAAGHGPAYLLTVDAEGRPRALAISVGWRDGAIVVHGLGRSTGDNVAARPDVAVLWTPPVPEGPTLIVDGSARLAADGSSAVVLPRSAILHVRREG